MEKKRVLVTGIGGNVGQGIIRNIKKSELPVEIVGCNITNFSAGNYLCDFFEKVSYAYSENYLNEISSIIKKYNIDLIIPSTDYEVFYLSKNKHLFDCQIAVSSAEAAEIYLNKHLSAIHHSKFQIPFAETVLPSEYRNQFDEYILKPKEGRGSRGIFINHPQPASFSDTDYILQKLAAGTEITTAFYVKKNGELHGLITMERTLENGATSFSKVITAHDKTILEKIIIPMINSLELRGSVNVQSIVTADGDIVPFEVNCRVSGTNSIRSNFGFEDVKYILQEYLFNNEPDKVAVVPGIAVRVLLDVIYPGATSTDKITTGNSTHYIF